MADDGGAVQWDDGSTVACDACGEPATLWCDSCSVLLCNGDGACFEPHAGHPVGLVASADDDAASVEDADADAGADNEGEAEEAPENSAPRCAAGDATAAAPSEDDRRPRFTHTVRQDIAEEDALHMLDVMESNAHTVCRRLFLCHTLAPTASLSAAQWQHFADHSYVVLDGFVPRATALAARTQTLALVASGVLTAYVNPKDVGRDTTARTDLRTFLTGDSPVVASGALRSLVDALDALRAELATGLRLTGERHEYQLAYYDSRGARYAKHRDAFPNDGTRPLRGQVGRRVTATLYMNDHQPGDGGELRMYPYCAPPAADVVAEGGAAVDAGAQFVDVAPVAGRCVLFLSGAMDHEVLPSRAERAAIAAWFS